jgi:hypothetical protein
MNTGKEKKENEMNNFEYTEPHYIFIPTLNTRSWKLQCSVTPVWDTLWDGTFSDSFENLMMNK